MTVAELKNRLSLNALCLPEPDREVTGGYTGDLLSWVMSNADEGDAWVTIMSNINVAAVASLRDVSCVILACGVELSAADLAVAMDKGINVLNSPLEAFELCCLIGELLK